MNDLRFKEIEHKFVVEADFDLDAFRQAVAALRPLRHVTLRVCDRYFLTEAGRVRGFVLRHRFDRELHELTLKTVVADAEVRDEVNLALRPGDQVAQVDAFVEAQGLVWKGALWKDLTVWHFDDCEVVHYVATAGDRTVTCVEFEAIRKDSLAHALAVLTRLEVATGFDAATRTHASLPALLWPEALADLGARP
ncbi:MAG: hypothetical protein HQ485_05445 [Acidobacteria bacterium]|jgi:hypothetical protein|nr:hypothetical protein [Acidobacteriota bacterium]